MGTTYATNTSTDRRSLRNVTILAALIITLVASVVAGYVLTRSGPGAGVPTAPADHPFVDGFVPAQPM